MEKIKGVFYFCLAAVALLLLFRLDAYLMDYDEGDLYLYPSMLVNEFGMKPYKDFTYTQPPLLLYLIKDIFTGRMISVVCVGVMTLGVFLIGRKFGVGYYAGVFAAACPLVIMYGRLAVGDIPLMAAFSLVLYPIVEGFKSKKTMILIGVMMWFAFMMKIQIMIPIGLLFLFLFVVMGEMEYILPMIVFIILIIGAEFYFPGMISSIIFNNTPNFDIVRAVSYLVMALVNFVVKANILVMFSLYGIYKYALRKERKYYILLVCLMSGVITALLYSWINYRHFMYLIPVLAVYAGLGLKHLKTKELAVCVMVFSLFACLPVWSKTTTYDSTTREISNNIFDAVKSGLIYTDQPMIAYMSHSKMPDTATLWNGMGRLRGLSVDDVKKDIDRRNPMMVLLVTSTPDNMEQPRITSTFGSNGSKDIIDYLDKRYPKKDYYRRDYQLIRIWKYV